MGISCLRSSDASQSDDKEPTFARLMKNPALLKGRRIRLRIEAISNARLRLPCLARKERPSRKTEVVNANSMIPRNGENESCLVVRWITERSSRPAVIPKQAAVANKVTTSDLTDAEGK